MRKVGLFKAIPMKEKTGSALIAARSMFFI
jgi:hypothetical protein